MRVGLVVVCSCLSLVLVAEAWVLLELSSSSPHHHLNEGSPLVSAALPRARGIEVTALSAKLTGVESAGVPMDEVRSMQQAIVKACRGRNVSTTFNAMNIMEDPVPSDVLGATGRVVLFRTSLDLSDEELSEMQSAISREVDGLIYSNPPSLSQPVLLSFQSDVPESRSDNDTFHHLVASIQNEAQRYELTLPLPCNPTAWSDCEAIVPSLHVEVDGAQVVLPMGDTIWDTSSVLVFDNVLNSDLRERLLNVVLGREDGDSRPAWDDTHNGPDPCRWERGGLLDVPGHEDVEIRALKVDSDALSWGLREEAISELCFERHDALHEFENIISSLFPQFTVTRLSEAILGAGVSPLTANAATYGDTFDWHIDADPMLTPPSPWTDVYGRYPNRCPGKPRFVSCIVYISNEWKPFEWGAPTRFLDVSTDTHFDVEAKSGRIVLMDQDITHSVVAPLEAAGERPRYSLVWKLILHPKQADQDMTDLGGKWKSKWPEPIRLGSAGAEPKDETKPQLYP